MAQIQAGYITNPATGEQVKFSDSTDFEVVRVKYHTLTGVTYVMYQEGTVVKVAKVVGNVVSAEINMETNATLVRANDFSLNTSGDRIFALVYEDNSGTWHEYYINTLAMSLIYTQASVVSSPIARVIHTGKDENYYLLGYSQVKNYNVSTKTVIGSHTATGVSSCYATATDIWFTRDTDPNIYKLPVDGDGFSGEVSYSGFSPTNQTPLGIVVSSGGDRAYFIVPADNSINHTNLAWSDQKRVLLDGFNLSNPTSLVIESTTNRVGFSATDDTTGKRNFYELKDDTVFLVKQDMGGYSKGNDFFGDQLSVMNQ